MSFPVLNFDNFKVSEIMRLYVLKEENTVMEDYIYAPPQNKWGLPLHQLKLVEENMEGFEVKRMLVKTNGVWVDYTVTMCVLKGTAAKVAFFQKEDKILFAAVKEGTAPLIGVLIKEIAWGYNL